mmetsp:Transcript_17452/g.19574  ORF Transcript_17452/g.19574 Transcript_17452/m.19574 type:complete len:187 (+) Transcript_17452:146-706(+)
MIVTITKVDNTALGVSCGYLASLAKQQTSSKPKYPKKELVAPRNIPEVIPTDVGTSIFGDGVVIVSIVILLGSYNDNPNPIINVTNITLVMVKKFVTRLDSWTPQAKTTTQHNDITPANGLKNDSVVLSILSLPLVVVVFVLMMLEDVDHSSTLSPQLRATAAPETPYSNVKQEAAMTAAYSPIDT